MSDSSRRGFLIVAGTGALAAGAAAIAPAAFAAGPREEPSPATLEAPLASSASVEGEGPLVAYVSDLATGEVSVMRGEREVVVHDRGLCASLARALS